MRSCLLCPKDSDGELFCTNHTTLWFASPEAGRYGDDPRRPEASTAVTDFVNRTRAEARRDVEAARERQVEA